MTDYSDPALDLRIDPDADQVRWMAFWGQKGSGKSVMARAYFTSWPYDEVAIDPTRDFDPHGEFTTPWPGRFEAPAKGETRVRYRYTPDRRRDPDWRQHLDDVYAAVLDHKQLDRGPVLVHADEIIAVFKANHVQPAAETMLHEGRHYDVWSTTCGPRCVGVDPMSVSQADDNFCWPMGIIDRRRMAEHASVPLDDLEAALKMAEPHGPVRITSDGGGSKRIIVYPAMPLS